MIPQNEAIPYFYSRPNFVPAMLTVFLFFSFQLSLQSASQVTDGITQLFKSRYTIFQIQYIAITCIFSMQLFIADVIVFVYMNHVGNVGKDITYSGNKSKPYYDALQWPG